MNNINIDENISEYKKALTENKNIISIINKTIPNEFKGEVELYSIRYISNECEVEGYAAFPKNKDRTKPLPGLPQSQLQQAESPRFLQASTFDLFLCVPCECPPV